MKSCAGSIKTKNSCQCKKKEEKRGLLEYCYLGLLRSSRELSAREKKQVG